MILLLGDIHGKLHELTQYIEKYDIGDCNIIQVGDFGYALDGWLMYYKKYIETLEKYNKFFEDRNIILHAIRGNHDDPKYFDGTIMLSNIKLHKDYTVLELENQRFLLVGGAISIDRENSKQKDNIRIGYPGIQTWFEGEEFKLDIPLLRKMENIDVVVTHTRPLITFDNDSMLQSFFKKDSKLKEDLTNEKANMTRMLNILKEGNNPNLRNWYYGHYHKWQQNDIDGIRFICTPQEVLVQHDKNNF